MNRRKFLVGGLGLIVVGALGCESVEERREREWKNKTIELEVGEGSASPVHSMEYNGMPNEKTFSLSLGNYSAVNTFYPISIKEFKFGNRKFRLDRVTPTKCTLTYLGKIKRKR